MFNTKTLVELGSFMTEDGNPDKWGEEDGRRRILIKI